MTRYLKVLGLALVAALAMSVTAASSASATNFKFHSEGTSTVLTGSQHAQNDVFTTDGGTVSCSNATYSGTQSGATVESVEVTPTYSGCTAFGFINVPIHVNGCKYKFGTSTTNYQGAVHVVCGSKPIEITAPGCTVTVGTQTPDGNATYTNVGSGTTREVTVDVNLSGIDYTEHDTFEGGCEGPTGTLKTNGTYKGAALVTGETSKKAHLGIWVG
ncbi:MAG TPA: hypothetical protein VHF50_08150 [Solirubrobacterales bacterium]|nr:hypothetical protein [Solirubrobacterales bacterium]